MYVSIYFWLRGGLDALGDPRSFAKERKSRQSNDDCEGLTPRAPLRAEPALTRTETCPPFFSRRRRRPLWFLCQAAKPLWFLGRPTAPDVIPKL